MPSHLYRSHCGRSFEHIAHRLSHQLRCHECAEVVSQREQDEFSSTTSRRTSYSEHTSVSNDHGSTDDNEVSFLLVLDSRRQRQLVAQLLQEYEPYQYIQGMSYFEPHGPPVYFRLANDLILPPFVPCCLRPSYGHFYIGYIRCNKDTVQETWLSAGENHRPQVEWRYCYEVYTSPHDVVAVVDGVCVNLLPSYAVGLLVHIFTKRHEEVMRELDRINRDRRQAFYAVANR